MMLSRFAVLLSLAAGIGAQAVQQPETSTPEPQRFIVEYAKGHAHIARRSLEEAEVDVVKTWESELFTGADIKSTNHSIETLLALPDVQRVWYNRAVTLAPVQVKQSFSDDAAAQNYSTHHTTGVFKLHQQGILGEGVKIGIVDSGVDYTHPALGGGIGPGFKVAGGYDLVGDGNWPTGPKQPDSNPMDKNGHGTHVAGIVAGQSQWFVGVAPKATIYSYKDFTSQGSTDDATLIDAFLRAYDDGVDIVTASIGGPSGWSDTPWAVVASRLVERDVLVTIAQGNSGDVGPFFGSSGSSGKEVLAVASVNCESGAVLAFKATFTRDSERNSSWVGYIPSGIYFPMDLVGAPIVPLSLATNGTDEACQPYPEGTRNLTGAIALVRRGTCSPQVKQKNLYALGARYVLLYNDEKPLAVPGSDNTGYIALIEAHSGEAIVKAIAAGYNVTADFSGGAIPHVSLPRTRASYPSSFTSWGGGNELELKPDIAAPGADIFSTYPGNYYLVLDGTSMACPYVAGVAALYIGAHGGRAQHGAGFAKMLARRIIASGESVPWHDDSSELPAPPVQVGAGLVNATKVLQSTTTLSFDVMSLNDTAHFRGSHKVTVRNNAAAPVDYTFEVEDAAGINMLYPQDTSSSSPRIKALAELVPVKMPPKVTLPPPFTLQPGESREVMVEFERPQFAEPSNLPLYSGKILVRGSDGNSLGVPYMGLGADLKAEMSDMFMARTPRTLSTPNLTSIFDKPYFNFTLYFTMDQQEDYLTLDAQLKWATKQLRWDIFTTDYTEANWTWPPVVGQNGYLGSVASWYGSSYLPWLGFGDADPWRSIPFPNDDLHRNGITAAYRYRYLWFGLLANGSQIELGDYKMRFAALKPFGDPVKAEDWSVFKAPVISVLGKFGPKPW